MKLNLDGDLAGHRAGFVGQVGVLSSGIQVSGTVTDPLSAPAVNGKFVLASQRMNDISKFFGPAIPLDYFRSLTGPVEVVGEISGSLTALNANNISAVIGRDNDRLAVSGSITDITTKPVLFIKMDAQSSELGSLISLAGIGHRDFPLLKAGPVRVTADLKGGLTSLYTENLIGFLGES